MAELSAAGWSDAAASAVSRARGSGQPVAATVQQAYNVMGSFIARVSASNEAAALQRLASACQAQMAAYPTTLQADEALLAECGEASAAPDARAHARLHALRAVVSEKRALEGAAAAIAAAQAALRKTADRGAAPKARRRL